ncbi:MAG: peptidyl-prolyl cis-trans isomerase, partial [Alphaproteobacteria bacterium]|nr:peptidyl-prolyl cis-trans isomerase [Alphaproteobacteria bacterium]
ILRAQGMSEDQLTASIRREMSVNMLGNAVQSGFLKTSETMTRDLAAYENEQRNVDYILFKDADLKEIEQPADEQLLKLYESTKEAYAIPEMRKSKLITIKMDTLKDSLEISDEEIKDVYERNISSYTQPETREIEQVILSDADQAEDIAKKIEAGASLKDATKEVTGNTTDYIPATSVEKTALLEELQEPVFTAKEGDLLGPIESGLGYHVAMLITITPAHTTSLETAKKDIRTELTETRLLDAQYDLAASLDDYLAASEPIETIKENLSVEIKDLPATNRFGIGENDKSAFNEEFGPDAQNMVSILFELGEGEASPVTELTDGRMSALLVENITEKSYKPFEDQKKALKKRWIDDSRRVQNKMHTLKLLTTAQGDGTSIKDLAKAKGRTLSSAKDLKRASEIEQPLTKAALGQIFEAKQNELFALDLDEGAAIMVVTNTTIPEKLKDEELKAAQNTHLQEMQNEAYTLYINSLRKKYGVRVNEKLLQMVYAPQDN